MTVTRFGLIAIVFIAALALLTGGCGLGPRFDTPSSAMEGDNQEAPRIDPGSSSLQRASAGEETTEELQADAYHYSARQGMNRYRLDHSGAGSAGRGLAFQEAMAKLAAKVRDSLQKGGYTENQLVVLPSTFVNLDDLNRTSTFGRLAAEMLAAELKDSGAEVVELRRSLDLMILPKTGELALSRTPEEIGVGHKANVILVGTYAAAARQVVLNVRLVRLNDNRLAAVGAMVFDRQGDAFINAMLLRESRSPSRQDARPRAVVGVATKFIPTENGGVREESLPSTAGQGSVQPDPFSRPKVKGKRVKP